MAMGPRPHRAVPASRVRSRVVAARLAAGSHTDSGRLRHDQSWTEHYSRRPAPVRAALRRRSADHHRHGRARGIANDDRTGTIGEPALVALRRSVSALAGVRLAGPGSGHGDLCADLCARPLRALPVAVEDVRRARAAIAGPLTKTPLVPPPTPSQPPRCALWLEVS